MITRHFFFKLQKTSVFSVVNYYFEYCEWQRQIYNDRVPLQLLKAVDMAIVHFYRSIFCFNLNFKIWTYFRIIKSLLFILLQCIH